MVVQFRHCADGRARSAHRIRLVDGDRRRDPLDAFDLRLVHAVEELPGIGGEGFNIPPLPLGIDGVKGEGGFSRAGDTSDDDQLPQRQVEIETFEIILPGAADAYRIFLFFHHRNNHRRDGFYVGMQQASLEQTEKFAQPGGAIEGGVKGWNRERAQRRQAAGMPASQGMPTWHKPQGVAAVPNVCWAKGAATVRI